MEPEARSRLTPIEYLEAERRSDVRHEYFNGEIFAMVGASEAHNLITTNVVAALHAQLRRGPCRLYVNDMRVQIEAADLFTTYPDVTAVCGEPRFLDPRRDTLLNPTVIFEVLSPSTEAYDRGQKFQHYRKLDSLTDYLLVAQDAAAVDHYFLQDGSWRLITAEGLDAVVEIPTLDARLALEEVYERVVVGE